MVQYVLTNLGKQRPWREGILEAPHLNIQFEGAPIEEIVKHCVLHDLRLSRSVDLALRTDCNTELREILLGSSADWLTWKATIEEGALELCCVDSESKHNKRRSNYRKCSVLLCRIPWFSGLKIRLSANTSCGDWEGLPSAYLISYQEVDEQETKKRKCALAVKYRLSEEVHRDVYTVEIPITSSTSLGSL